MPVQQSWQRIVGWLAAHAPETAAGIRPPAGEDALRSAEATFPYSWPEDLREWYGLHDGASSQQLFTGVLPGYAELLSLDGTVAASREYQDVFSDMDDDDADALGDAADAEEAEAGAMAYRFLRSWVPIAQDGTACTMFVDCRPGAGYGCVTRFEREDADTGGPVWDSVDAMLAELAEALEHGGACGGWWPQVSGGVVEWDPDDPQVSQSPA